MLLEMLNDSFDKLFFIEYSKDASNRNFKVIKLCEDFIVDIFFVVEVWSYFRFKLVLSSLFKISKCEEYLLILRDRIKSEVQFHLYESIV